MPVDIDQTLRQAITKLQQEKQRIDRQITALETAMHSLNAGGIRSDVTRGQPAKGRQRGRRRMSPAERKAIGRRMKAYWANRRSKAKAKKQ
ncbi:MAG: hypothetical protein E6G75_20535 [Alphaproteobacteria bacterium]|nr:MAG: hypothetical protein E6G75_20535 [Alphaproteobacteria bacterium]